MVQLTDGNGKVTKTYEYDSFGNEVKPDEKNDNPFRYCGGGIMITGWKQKRIGVKQAL